MRRPEFEQKREGPQRGKGFGEVRDTLLNYLLFFNLWVGRISFPAQFILT
jgi:hypothetical protein